MIFEGFEAQGEEGTPMGVKKEARPGMNNVA
jgi:hypothetical protein